MDQYLYHLDCVRSHLPPQVRFWQSWRICRKLCVWWIWKLHIISKLRCDANLRYLYAGVQKRRGRPASTTAGWPPQTAWAAGLADRAAGDLYGYRLARLRSKRTIRVAYLVDRRHPARIHLVYCSAPISEQDPMPGYQFYKLRFQIEFIFRDAKQFTGLEDCQAARDALREFIFNASLSALSRD